MITLFLFSFYTVFSVLEARRCRDVFHPLMLYTLPFLLQYIIYLLLYESDNPVTCNTLIIYVSSITIFILFYYLFEKIFGFYIQNQTIKTVVIKTGLLRIIAIVTIVSLTMEVGGAVLSNGMETAYRFMRHKVNYGDGMGFFSKYLPVLYNTAFILWITELFRQKKLKKEKINAVVYSILFFAFAFFSFSRTNLLMALCAFCYCILQNNETISMNAKKALSKTLFIGLALVLLLSLFSWIANATDKMGDDDFKSSNYYVWKYLGYPLITMDMYATMNPGVSSGRFSLGFVGKVLDDLELLDTEDMSMLPKKGQFNVFSYIGSIYLDFGLYYVIAQLFIALLVAYIYAKNKKCGGKWTVLYAFYSYAILISFYSNQYYLTDYIYIYILSSALEKSSALEEVRYCA